MDALAQIRSELAQDARSRRLRGGLLLLLFGLFVLGFGAAKGLRSDLTPRDLVALAGALSFVLLGIAAAIAPALWLSDRTATILAAIAFASPLIAATGFEPQLSGLSCFLTIGGIGVGALLVARMILGPVRRRFGGAALLQAVACTSIGLLAVGLECPATDGLHLLIHAGAAVLVIVGGGRLLLR
jgi:hypothetical protein